MVEHFTRNEEVASSILASGSMKKLFIPCIVAVLVSVFYFVVSTKSSYVFFRKEDIAIQEKNKPLLFAGDIMLGRFVETLGKEKGDSAFPFKEVTDFLKEHTTIANLEGPIPHVHEPTPINGFTFSFPGYVPEVLRKAGISAVSLANNHMFDHGVDGYTQTKLALDKGGVAHFGGYTPTQADYFETKIGDKETIVYGITMIATGWDEAQAIEVTKELRLAHPGAYLIAFLHWGDEYKTQNIYQRAFAHVLIDNGVDAIIGSHPHVVQGIELYNKKPIIYSLGNFVFDQYWSKETQDGVMVKIEDMKTAYRYELIPIVENRSVPHTATSTDKQRILSAMSKQSSPELQSFILNGTFEIEK